MVSVVSVGRIVASRVSIIRMASSGVRMVSIVSTNRGEPRWQHLVHRRAGREEFVEHAEASHVGRGSAVPYHEIRDVVLCVPILALARATRAAAAERVQATRERAKRWQWLYQRGFKCGVAHMPKVCPISCAKTRTARKLMRPLVPLNGFSVVTWRLSELTAPPEPRHTELKLAYEWQ